MTAKLKSATATAALLPVGIGGDGGAVLDTADLHPRAGEGAKSGLCAGTRGLGAVTAGSTQLDVQSSDTQSLNNQSINLSM